MIWMEKYYYFNDDDNKFEIKLMKKKNGSVRIYF